MNEEHPIKVVLTWLPRSIDIDRIKTCTGGIEVVATEDREEALRLLEDAEVAFVTDFDLEMLRAAKKLRWVQAASAGAERCLFPEFVESPIPLTCFKGCFDIPGSEHALASILAFSYRIPDYLRQQARRTIEWVPPTELKGRTVGIIGLGSIGRELARKVRCLQMCVIGMTRHPHDVMPDVDELLLPDQLPRLLAASDFVVVAVPNTPETQGLIGEAELRQMNETTYLIDISGRDALFDWEALVRALKERWIAGADLQINRPLPPDSPLWELDNVILSQYSANSHEQYERCMDRFCENLRRYREGRPLLGLVDKAAGY